MYIDQRVMAHLYRRAIGYRAHSPFDTVRFNNTFDIFFYGQQMIFGITNEEI